MNPLMVVGLFINATALAHAVVLWLALCVIAVHVIRTQGDGLSKWGLRALGLRPGRRVLLVIAHPDDESMFFAPAVAAAVSSGAQVSVLCLSTGDFAGLGALRSAELRAACAQLGVPAERTECVDRRDLQDGPEQRWPAAAVASCVAASVARTSADTLLTFDRKGCSGHPNHVAVHRAVRAWLRGDVPGASAPPQGLPQRTWELETCPLPLKFLGPAPAVFFAAATALGWSTVPCCVAAPGVASRALRLHATQWVWFRKLFVRFSWYSYCNRLKRIGRRA